MTAPGGAGPLLEVLAFVSDVVRTSAPAIFETIEDAIRGGATFEEALAKARSLDPGPIDTSAADRARREAALATASDRKE